MATLTYLPWCPIDGTYPVGEIVILPFDPSAPPVGLDSSVWSRVCTILGAYRDIKGQPIQRAALVQIDGKSLVDDLADDDLDTIADLSALACFCGLANREFFRGGQNYW